MLEALAGYLRYNQEAILSRFVSFFTEVVTIPDLIWIVIPLIITILIMQIYFARYKLEKAGWNTVTANSLVLLFLASDLFRVLSNKGFLRVYGVGSYEFALSFLVFCVLGLGVLLFALNFFHLWPEVLAFKFASHLNINLFAYLMLIIVYGFMPLNTITLTAGILFFVVMNIFFFTLKKIL